MTDQRRFDRVLLVRHLAICAGAVMAYVWRAELRIGYTALWIVAISAALNYSAYLFRTRPGLAVACEQASPVIGVGSWTALVLVTGGIRSPFVAGYWLEIALSAMTMGPRGIASVTVASVVALVGQQLAVGLEGVGVMLTLQSGFVVGMGCATFLVTRRFRNVQRSLSERQAKLVARLDSLESELADERDLGRLGDAETVGRLAHGLKNAVHSLRGFASLIEPTALKHGSEAAIAGLRTAIDDLEALALITLESRPAPPAAPSGEGPGTPDAAAVIAGALAEIRLGSPNVHWTVDSDGAHPELGIPASELHEVLLVLLRNAVEAMSGTGEGRIETRTDADTFRVTIVDHGSGLSEEALSDLFRPGRTTKDKGSGYGLFLARRTLKQHGGQLSARPGTGSERGAIFELALPRVSGRDRGAAHGH